MGPWHTLEGCILEARMISYVCTKFSSSLSKFSRLTQLMSPNDCEFQHKLWKFQSMTLKKTDYQWCNSYIYVLYWSHTATLGIRPSHIVKKAERFTTLTVSISSSLCQVSRIQQTVPLVLQILPFLSCWGISSKPITVTRSPPHLLSP